MRQARRNLFIHNGDQVLVDLLDNIARIDSQYATNHYQFDNIQSPLPTFAFGYERLRLAEKAGQRLLRQPGGFPRGNQPPRERLIFAGENGFHIDSARQVPVDPT